MLYSEFESCQYIINMISFGQSISDKYNNKLCIALEYMHLLSISSLNYYLSQDNIKYIIYSILNALDYIHCIHNDIKPDS